MSPAEPTGPATQQPPPALVRALRHLLRPLVRLLLAHRVTHPAFARLLKSVYVDVAREELAASGERQTASRLSLFTGVHRKDLRVLMEQRADDYAPPAAVSLGARLVRRWTGEARFRDGRGRPRPLPRLADAAGGGASFEELVAGASKDIRPRAVLDEWLRLGVVEIDAQDRVRLCVAGFVPVRGFDEKAHYFGRNLHDHIAAATHNLAGREPPLLERSVYSEGLSQDSVDELAALSEELGMRTLREIDARAAALRRRDARKPGDRQRINFGIYLFRAGAPPAAADEPDDD
jgi:hypothetical protein